ncbi:MAG: TetR/AcrR family transcriptional regulator [Hyphomicrobiaceae bacterium]|nr:TetR/AcrR family transcriptional regulator [Hyphomicrobiaceae bacterium]
MLDFATPLGRVLKAALDLAAEKPWGEVTLSDIAVRAGTTLAEMREHCTGKTDLLAKLLRAVDDEVLRTAPRPADGVSRRDALFEVIMARFDLLQPFKPALRSIHASGAADFTLAAPYLASQHWMLQAAGIGTDGLAGGARVAGLALAYAQAYRTWLADDDPGLGKTMASLDRLLRRGESALKGLETAGTTLGRMARTAAQMAKGAARAAQSARKTDTSPPPPEPPAAAPEPGKP